MFSTIEIAPPSFSRLFERNQIGNPSRTERVTAYEKSALPVSISRVSEARRFPFPAKPVTTIAKTRTAKKVFDGQNRRFAHLII